MNDFRPARIAVVLAAFLALVVPAAATDWSPPIGIPSPSFGIFEAAPPSPTPWTAGTPGFYYVDATNSASSDSNNPYGTPAKPRRTLPSELPAGSVVELHGTYDTGHSIVAQGTSARPVYIRGASVDKRPLVRRGWEIKGTYAILENLEFGPTPDQSNTGSLVIRLPASHIVLRHSDVHGTLKGGGLGIVNWEVGYGEIYTGTGVIDNVVIYDNTVHDNGDVLAKTDQDAHGISVTDHVNHLWVVDNQLYRNSGDGIQIVAPGKGQAATTHHIYVGRNIAHHNKQTGFWVKQATDVIFSQNVSYAHRPSNSSLGQCMGGQYAPDWVWFLYNRVTDCEYGIALMSDEGEPSHTFVIGNVIHNIHRTVLTNRPDDAWGPAGIIMTGGDERHFVNNTTYDVDSGVNIATSLGSLEVADNIIANVTQPRASHVLLGFQALAANTTVHHDVLFGDPRIEMGNGQVHLNNGQLATLRSIADDPQFVDVARGDFHVAATSPAANRGELNAVYGTFQQRYGLSIAVDADGKVRPPMATADIGAYLAAGAAAAAVQEPSPATPACVAEGIPSAPSGLTLVSQGGGSLTIAWLPAACGVATQYVVESGTAPGDPGLVREVSAPTTMLQSTLDPGTYYMRVRARNALGVSPPSNEIQVGGVPGSPGRLTAVVAGGRLTLSWSAPATGGTPNGFLIEMGYAPGVNDQSATVPATMTSVTSGSPAKTSYFRIRAVSVAGTSQPSNEAIVTVK
jgi:hypothetical protein